MIVCLQSLFNCCVVVSKGWATGADDHFVAVAEYNFNAENPDELSFQQGNKLNIAPKGLLAINNQFNYVMLTSCTSSAVDLLKFASDFDCVIPCFRIVELQHCMQMRTAHSRDQAC
jgi:hypothetical protein